MEIIRKVYFLVNPIKHLGERKYSIFIPLVTNVIVFVLSEIYAYYIAKNPLAVGSYIIFINVALIMYFAFRHGIRGGVISSMVTIFYYLYIIQSRKYTGSQLTSGLDTTLMLAAVYLLLSLIIGWLKQTIDVLIEREADERRRLEAIVQQLPVGILITDQKGRLIQRNKVLDSILGIKIPIGFTFGADTIHNAKIDGKSINPSHSPVVQALATGKIIAGKVFHYERPDGRKAFLQVNSSVIKNPTGKVIAAASIVEDITEQKQMEERKDDFVNMASHELKTPITSMKLYINSLNAKIKKHNDTQSIKILGNISNQTERLQKLVNDLLDVSRLQTGKLTFTKELFDITALIEEVIESMDSATKNQTIIFSNSRHFSVFADKFRIYQVLTNLLTNAIKYSPEGKEIRVKVTRADGKVMVSVQDFGIGIAPDQKKKVFDRLYQVIDDKEKTFPGFGMGLYIAKEIITRHKGKIWVESEKGYGSTFYFTLPIENKKV